MDAGSTPATSTDVMVGDIHMFSFFKQIVMDIFHDDTTYNEALLYISSAKTFDDFRKSKELLSSLEQSRVISESKLSYLKKFWVLRYKLWKEKLRE